MLQDFKNFIKELNRPHAKFAVAVSGGIDSTVLCELCKQAEVDFSIVHCNFKLRGEESDRDEQFVRSLGEKYGVKVLVKSFETEAYAINNKCSVQVAARELRYQWFHQLYQEDKNVYILLAHHANDNIETVLMNFFRGTGLEGMTGMPSKIEDSHILRPLLPNTRKEIQEFAKVHQLTWVEDSSNQSSKYTRNFFRNEIIPLIQKVYPTAEQNLLDNIKRFEGINELYKIGFEKIKSEVIEKHLQDIIIPIHKLRPYKDTSFIYELIKEYGFGEKQVEEVIKLMESESGKYLENESYQIIRHRKNLIITPKLSAAETAVAVEKNTKQVQLSDSTLLFEECPIKHFKLNKSEKVANMDAALIEFPLLVRRWKQGDYFYPLGLRKKKKLARFFIDQKLSKADKEKIWVIESNQRIVWVVGLRIDDRFKVTEKTKNVLLITQQ